MHSQAQLQSCLPDFSAPLSSAGGSQNHRMVWVGRNLKYNLVPTPLAMGRDTFHYTMLLRAPSNLALNTSREGEPQLLWATCSSASPPS